MQWKRMTGKVLSGSISRRSCRRTGAIWRVCTLELWAECFCKDPGSFRKSDAYELNAIMSRIEGWKRYDGNKTGRVRFPLYGPQYAYQRCV